MGFTFFRDTNASIGIKLLQANSVNKDTACDTHSKRDRICRFMMPSWHALSMTITDSAVLHNHVLMQWW